MSQIHLIDDKKKDERIMSQIHLIDGDKGGVGKSFFARASVYYLNLKKLNFHCQKFI
jgi:hypothetical protein